MADIYDTGPTAAVADERTTLAAFLNYYREAFAAKVVGVSEEDARRRLVPSATTLAGLVKHLCRVEMSWFQHRLAQIPVENLPELRRWLDDPESKFLVVDDETVDLLVVRYRRQCEISREGRSTFRSRPRRSTPSSRRGIGSPDHRAHDRRDRAPCWSCRHPARTDRRVRRRLTSFLADPRGLDGGSDEDRPGLGPF